MNNLKPEIVERLDEMLSSGESVRTIMKVLGIAKQTIHSRRELVYARFSSIPVCKCGLISTHQGWCKYRMAKSPARQAVMRQLKRPDPERRCMDCGGPLALGAGLRCLDCHQYRAARRREEWAAKTVPCKICCALISRNAKGSFDWHCQTEWCQRLFAFYYVEGRNRPPSVQDARKKGLSFEVFLSDYIRRNANEIYFGAKYRGSA